MYQLDMNSDLGESFGIYTLGNDEEMMKVITSANIACGFHAGDANTIHKTVNLAMQHNVAIGAHPGLPDLMGFGRRNMDITPQEAYDFVLYQVGAVAAFVKAEGGRLNHVKVHGQLYNMAAVNAPLAKSIAMAVYKMDSDLILYGLSGSELIQAGNEIGLRTASEVFADRTYQSDGTLSSRKLQDSMITDPKVAVQQVITMVTEGTVLTREGQVIPIHADTVCIHGDGLNAVEFASSLRNALELQGISVGPILYP